MFLSQVGVPAAGEAALQRRQAAGRQPADLVGQETKVRAAELRILPHRGAHRDRRQHAKGREPGSAALQFPRLWLLAIYVYAIVSSACCIASASC